MASAIDPKRAFLGSGLAFPPAADSHGAIAMVSYEEDIRQSIQIILATNPGERVMRPDFGAGLRDFVFEPADLTTVNRLSARVRESLIDFERRMSCRPWKSPSIRSRATNSLSASPTWSAPPTR